MQSPDPQSSVEPVEDAAEAPGPLFQLRWGLERETHRLSPDGSLARTAHPAVLASPSFTRDFAETQLEIATRPHRSIPELLRELERLTAAARAAVAPEVLWSWSMPPSLPAADRITVADLGESPGGRQATLYRHGLALRYGKDRQMICGVHLNVSVGAPLLEALATEAPLSREERYECGSSDGFLLRLARNLYRDLPVLVLLTGASPLRGGREDAGTFAVSWRNGGSGYGGTEYLPFLQLDSVDGYVSSVRRGLRTQSSAFARLPLVHQGIVRQLSGTVFQAEKEFYAPIRLRQAARAGETGLQALSRRGIGYLELRFLDVAPGSTTGVSEDVLRLLHLVVLDGLATPSRVRRPVAASARAALRIAAWDPTRLATATGARRSFLRVAGRRLGGLERWARRLDAVSGRDAYASALGACRRRVADTSQLPSASLATAFTASGLGWTSFALRNG